jgi:hypothetical protein
LSYQHLQQIGCVNLSKLPRFFLFFYFHFLQVLHLCRKVVLSVLQWVVCGEGGGWADVITLHKWDNNFLLESLPENIRVLLIHLHLNN